MLTFSWHAAGKPVSCVLEVRQKRPPPRQRPGRDGSPAPRPLPDRHPNTPQRAYVTQHLVPLGERVPRRLRWIEPDHALTRIRKTAERRTGMVPPEEQILVNLMKTAVQAQLGEEHAIRPYIGRDQVRCRQRVAPYEPE